MQPIVVTSTAWQKMASILQKTQHHGFVLSARGGGCNGFNYHLQSHREVDLRRFFEATTQTPTVYRPKLLWAPMYVDPYSEELLRGTTIDYEAENLHLGIYSGGFTFTPRGGVASSCGCGVSFAPRATPRTTPRTTEEDGARDCDAMPSSSSSSAPSSAASV